MWRSPVLCSCICQSCLLGSDNKVGSTRCHRLRCVWGSQWSGGVSHRAAAGLLLAKFQSAGCYGYCGEWEHWAVNNWRAVCFAAALLALSKVSWVPTQVGNRSHRRSVHKHPPAEPSLLPQWGGPHCWRDTLSHFGSGQIWGMTMIQSWKTDVWRGFCLTDSWPVELLTGLNQQYDRQPLLATSTNTARVGSSVVVEQSLIHVSGHTCARQRSSTGWLRAQRPIFDVTEVEFLNAARFQQATLVKD